MRRSGDALCGGIKCAPSCSITNLRKLTSAWQCLARIWKSAMPGAKEAAGDTAAEQCDAEDLTCWRPCSCPRPSCASRGYLVSLLDLGVHALENRRCLTRRTQLVTSTTAPYCSAEDVNCWFELPKSELPEAFPRFSEDSFEATLPRGGCRGLQARPLHLVAADAKVF